MSVPVHPEPHEVRRFESSAGAQIFQIPLEVFPGFWGYAYAVWLPGTETGRVLIDTGSGFGNSSQHLEEGLAAVSDLTGQDFSPENLTHILITHGHVDHFGGLAAIRPRTPARIGVHELDLRVLTHYEERLVVIARRLDVFLAEAGVSAERRKALIEMYKLTKSLYSSVKVDFTYEAAGMRVGPFELLHVPGHCAGHVVLRLHDVLFSGDHILDRTSPHQSPEHLTLYTGLGHYLQSLEKLRRWAPDVRLVLGGHKEPIHDLAGRIDEIEALHIERLNKVLDFLEQPHTIKEISQILFGEVNGYNVLLALEEAGAHVEYLYQRGRLGIHNLEDIEDSLTPVAIQYYRLPEA